VRPASQQQQDLKRQSPYRRGYSQSRAERLRETRARTSHRPFRTHSVTPDDLDPYPFFRPRRVLCLTHSRPIPPIVQQPVLVGLTLFLLDQFPLYLLSQGGCLLAIRLVLYDRQSCFAAFRLVASHRHLLSPTNYPMRSSSTIQRASCSTYNNGCQRRISRRKSARRRVAQTKDPAIDDWIG
jgi:hypothetical protein